MAYRHQQCLHVEAINYLWPNRLPPKFGNRGTMRNEDSTVQACKFVILKRSCMRNRESEIKKLIGWSEKLKTTYDNTNWTDLPHSDLHNDRCLVVSSHTLPKVIVFQSLYKQNLSISERMREISEFFFRCFEWLKRLYCD